MFFFIVLAQDWHNLYCSGILGLGFILDLDSDDGRFLDM